MTEEQHNPSTRDGRTFDGCSCGVTGPGSGSTPSDRHAWFQGHVDAAAAARRRALAERVFLTGGVPIVDLSRVVEDLEVEAVECRHRREDTLELARSLERQADYLDELAGILRGTGRATDTRTG